MDPGKGRAGCNESTALSGAAPGSGSASANGDAAGVGNVFSGAAAALSLAGAAAYALPAGVGSPSFQAGAAVVDGGSPAGVGCRAYPARGAKLATQAIRHHAMDDMQAEASAALVAAGGKERVERLPPDVRAHAAAVVAKDDLDIIDAEGAHLDGNISLPAVRKRMRDRVEEKVGQHLRV